MRTRRGLVDEGEPTAPAVALLHDAGGSADAWAPILPALTPRYRVVAPDLEASSDVAALGAGVAELLRSLGVEGFAAVGHGLGGAVAQVLASHHGAQALVLIGSPRADGVRPEELDVPALVVSGEEDAIVPSAAAERLADALPDGSLVLLPGVAHDVPLEAPDTVGPLVAEFLRARWLGLPHGHDHAHAGPVTVPLLRGRPGAEA